MDLIEASSQIYNAEDMLITLPSYIHTTLSRGEYDSEAIKNFINLKKRNERGSLKAKKILIPLHINGNHWVLCQVNIIEKTIYGYDSMDDNTMDNLRVLLPWLKQEKFQPQKMNKKQSNELTGILL